MVSYECDTELTSHIEPTEVRPSALLKPADARLPAVGRRASALYFKTNGATARSLTLS